MSIEQQVVVVYAATKGYLDRLEVSQISTFQENLLQQTDAKIFNTIRDEKVISDSLNNELKQFMDRFTERFCAAHIAKG
jgi:F0F1-type ATP synthase alpha subunit